MGAGFQKFEILLNNSDKTFSPGEIVTGRVIIELLEKQTITGLEITCKGEGVARYTYTKFSLLQRTTTYHSTVDDYFQMGSYLLGSPHGESVEIDSGLHAFPFAYVLPKGIPSSFKHSSTFSRTMGKVSYTIEATVHVAWAMNVRRSVSLAVQAPYDLCLFPIAKLPIEDQMDENLGCFPFNAGVITVNISTPTCGFAIGEFIEAKIGINNHSTHSVKKIKLRLKQQIQLHGPEAPLRDEVTLRKAEKLGPFGNEDSITMCMQVPETPPSGMPFCNVMTIQYYLYVEFVMPGIICNVTRRYPILIGTKAALPFNSAENTNTSPPQSNEGTDPSIPEVELHNLSAEEALILLCALRSKRTT